MATRTPTQNIGNPTVVLMRWAMLTSEAVQGLVPTLVATVRPLPRAFRTRPMTRAKIRIDMGLLCFWMVVAFFSISVNDYNNASFT